MSNSPEKLPVWHQSPENAGLMEFYDTFVNHALGILNLSPFGDGREILVFWSMSVSERQKKYWSCIRVENSLEHDKIYLRIQREEKGGCGGKWGCLGTDGEFWNFICHGSSTRAVQGSSCCLYSREAVEISLEITGWEWLWIRMTFCREYCLTNPWFWGGN